MDNILFHIFKTLYNMFMSTIKIYNAGPLFTEYEVKQRKEEGKILRGILDNNNIKGYEVFNPIEFNVNPTGENSKQPLPEVIYEADAKCIDASTAFFFDLCNNDTGTFVELGMTLQKLRNKENIKIYPVISDFRATANSRLGFESTIGFNSFVIGGIKKHGFKVFTSFEEATKQFKKDFKLK